MAFNKKAPIHWFGGKFNLKSHILPYLDCGLVYVEPYGGAGAILFAKDPHPCEVYNDINSDLCNLMRTLQNPERAQKLYDRLVFTLYSKEEFCLAIDILNDKNSSKDDRAWSCPSCGARHDRDVNAARVIAQWAAKYREERGNLCLLTEKTPENSGVCRDGTARDDAGKAPRTRAQGCAQRAAR